MINRHLFNKWLHELYELNNFSLMLSFLKFATEKQNFVGSGNIANITLCAAEGKMGHI
jgi:hypothetical protein